MRTVEITPSFEARQATSRPRLREGVAPPEVAWQERTGAPTAADESAVAGGATLTDA